MGKDENDDKAESGMHNLFRPVHGYTSCYLSEMFPEMNDNHSYRKICENGEEQGGGKEMSEQKTAISQKRGNGGSKYNRVRD
ncbi:hypothetical protein NDS46_01450 [Paenibacillus thiaminolyticus]|uniref:hypothetical protein n=1 Tax=Paenibacillus thiaminolyticus TaxID=49283 RepID=UPI00232F16AB|nr:hypothetical protein [Paenibacillus thiaminolyticus]WCF08614.1 hypothetical protein NDS46_01450 [Paenibacillus thiaminolyticus]